MKYRFVGLFLLFGLFATVSAGSFAATVTPHRATYALLPAQGYGSKDARVVEGLAVFEFSDDCDGHTTSDRTVILLSSQDGGRLTIDSQYSAWESKDGLNFRFMSTLKLNGQDLDVIRGSAVLDARGGTGKATFVSPKAKVVDLPAGTMFPVAASIDTLDQIETGHRQLSYMLFDGSSEDGPHFATDYVIDQPFPGAELDVEGDVVLLDGPAWRIRTAIFSAGGGEGIPDTEMDGQAHDNGIISRFILENDTFVAEGRLTRIEALPESGC